MKIKELMEILKDMDPEGSVNIWEPDREEGIGWTRHVKEMERLWSTEAHDANGKPDRLCITLED